MKEFYEQPGFDHVTRDEILTLYATQFSTESGHPDSGHSEKFIGILRVYAQQQERKALQNKVHPGRANLECALHMAELYLQVGFVAEAHDSYEELAEAAEHEQAFDLLHRINSLRRTV